MVLLTGLKVTLSLTNLSKLSDMFSLQYPASHLADTQAPPEYPQKSQRIFPDYLSCRKSLFVIYTARKDPLALCRDTY